MKQNHSILIYLLIALCLFGYIVPWVIVPTSPLTLGAYDLAEWTTLHPTQSPTSPPLNIAFVIRLQLVIITLLVGFNAHTEKSRFFNMILIIGLVIAQLPPLDFLITESGNINYQQQFTFAIVSLFAGYILTFFKPTRFIPVIVIILAIIGIVSSIVGLNAAQQLYTTTLIEHTPGGGIILLGIGYAGIAFVSLRGLQFQQLSINEPQQIEQKQGSV